MTQHFPAFFALSGRTCLVVGTTAAARRKATMLREAGACVRQVGAAQFDPHQLAGCTLAVVATGDDAADRSAAGDAAARGVPVNVVDRPDLSSFIVPAVIDRAPLTIAISSGGAAPSLARLLRARIETLIPAAYGDLAGLAQRWRVRVHAAIVDGATRRRFWDAVFTGSISRLVFAGRTDDAEHALRHALLRMELQRAAATQGQVAVVGAGPGDPELLTLKALRLLQEADAIVHRPGIAPEIIGRGRRDAAIAAAADPTQRDALLVRLVRQGLNVVWLHEGASDPDAAAALAAAGIAAEIVPGVDAAPTAASAGARAA